MAFCRRVSKRCLAASALAPACSPTDHEIYRKFRMDCHPCVNRAGVGLAALVNASPKTNQPTNTEY